MYSNAAFYNILRGNPFTAYGETFMVLVQTFIVVNLIWFYDAKIGSGNIALACATYAAYCFLVFQGEDITVFDECCIAGKLTVLYAQYHVNCYFRVENNV